MSLNMEQAIIMVGSAVITSDIMPELMQHLEDGSEFDAAAFGTLAGGKVSGLVDATAAEVASELEGKNDAERGVMMMDAMTGAVTGLGHQATDGEEFDAEALEAVEGMKDGARRFIGISSVILPEMRGVIMVMGGMPLIAMAVEAARRAGTEDRDGLVAAAKEFFAAYMVEAGELPEGMADLAGQMDETLGGMVDSIIAGEAAE